MSAQLLIALSAAIVLVLGLLHLFFTFFGTRFQPRDAALGEQMKVVSPRITGQTSMWRAWVGFNASHSLGAMLFGLIYGYLALSQPLLLQHSSFLLGLGALFLASLLLLARRYWFRVPLIGISCALVLYLSGLSLL